MSRNSQKRFDFQLSILLYTTYNDIRENGQQKFTKLKIEPQKKTILHTGIKYTYFVSRFDPKNIIVKNTIKKVPRNRLQEIKHFSYW